MKKIVLVFLALVVFSLPFQQTYVETQAALFTKAGTAAGKKLLKEVIKDATANQAANMVLLEAQEIADKYSAKQGYKLACPDGKKTCAKPIQVKYPLTDADINNLSTQIDKSMDKKIAGGINATRFGKFIDWFMPLWLITAAGTALDYAINGDDGIAGLIKDIGHDALITLGFIQPAEPLTPTSPITDPITDIGTNPPVDAMPISMFDNIFTVHAGERLFNLPMPSDKFDEATLLLEFQPNTSRGIYIDFYDVINGGNYGAGHARVTQLSAVKMTVSFSVFPDGQMRVTSNGKQVITRSYPHSSGTIFELSSSNSGHNWNGGEYSLKRTLIKNTETGFSFQIQTETDLVKFDYTGSYRFKGFDKATIAQVTAFGAAITYFPSKYDVELQPRPLQIEDLTALPEPLDNSKYKTDTGFKVPPIDSVTYKDSITGEPLIIERDENKELIFTRPDGTPVPDDNIVVEDGNIAPNPDGKTVYTPVNPSPENPGKIETEIPLEPKPTEPPPTTPPGEEPPAEPFPEGEKCDAKLKFPIFSPLKETFSTSFPFSIPWDIGRAIEAGFGGISDEKPGFTLSLPFMGEDFTMEITTPKLFDKWKPFTDTFLLLTFDVLIMFGVFRFVKGAGS